MPATAVLPLARAAPDGGAPLLAASNFSGEPARLDSALLEEAGLNPGNCRDLISPAGRREPAAGGELQPLQSVWLVRGDAAGQAAGG